MNVKELYTSPEVEIVNFDNEDVITTSLLNPESNPELQGY